MKEKKYKVRLLPPTINEEIINAENMVECYNKIVTIINRYPELYLNILIEEMEDEQNEQEMEEDEENE